MLVESAEIIGFLYLVLDNCVYSIDRIFCDSWGSGDSFLLRYIEVFCF